MYEDKMSVLTGKIIEAKQKHGRSARDHIGPALRKLRELSQLSQEQLAAILQVHRNTVSSIENKSDLKVSVIQKYVEALGARLQIDASFSMAASIALHVRELTSIKCYDDDQLVLPIFESSDFQNTKEFILSIKPQYSDAIIAGKKTVELRRRFPVNVPTGSRAYIYSTSPIRAIVGSFKIIEVLKLPTKKLWSQFSKTASICKSDFESYFGDLEEGFAIKLGSVKTFGRPVNLTELRKRFGFEPPQSFLYATPKIQRALLNEIDNVSN
jgi:predicted transcriptional regulator/DNA-binding XRE family transcriptional regulator